MQGWTRLLKQPASHWLLGFLEKGRSGSNFNQLAVLLEPDLFLEPVQTRMTSTAHNCKEQASTTVAWQQQRVSTYSEHCDWLKIPRTGHITDFFREELLEPVIPGQKEAHVTCFSTCYTNIPISAAIVQKEVGAKNQLIGRSLETKQPVPKSSQIWYLTEFRSSRDRSCRLF